MAIIPIYFGSYKSVDAQKRKKDSGEEVETLTTKDAAMFPLIASGALFSIYIIFRIFSKEYINLLLTFYFVGLGVAAVTKSISPIIRQIMPSCFPNANYHLDLTENHDKESPIHLIAHSFDRVDLVALLMSALMGVWYFIKKHWIANNIFGLAFSLNAVELLHLNKVSTGCILLIGLFVYDIFWVFGTSVMVSVAKSFEAPIKIVFPRDIITRGIWASDFAMLGLGDIVVPGVFIALLLRYDKSRGQDRSPYFWVCFVAYIAGLVLTIIVMHIFKAAQPALLYLVPACVGSPLLVACFKSDLKSLFTYEDHPVDDTATTAAGDELKKTK